MLKRVPALALTVTLWLAPAHAQEMSAPLPPDMAPVYIGEIQLILGQRGYYQGPVSGQMTPATVQAIGRYQYDSGLPMTGVPDTRLYNALHAAPVPAPALPAAMPPAPQPPAPVRQAYAPLPPAPSPAAEPVPPAPSPPIAGFYRSAPPALPSRPGAPAVAALSPAPAAVPLPPKAPAEEDPEAVVLGAVRALQEILISKGFYQGPASGEVTAETIDALCAFAKSRQMPEEGAEAVEAAVAPSLAVKKSGAKKLAAAAPGAWPAGVLEHPPTAPAASGEPPAPAAAPRPAVGVGPAAPK